MTNKEKETLETMQTLTSLKYGSSVVCERKDIEILLNLIKRQQKEINDLYIKVDDKETEIQHLNDDLEYSDKRIFYLENEVRKKVNKELDKAKFDLYKNYVPKETIREKMKELEITDCTIRYNKYAIQDILKEILGEIEYEEY